MSPMLAVLGLSGGELMLVMVVILVLFGAKKIPDFAKGLGQGIKEFKKASREVQDEIERATEETYTPPPSPPTPPYAPPAEVKNEPVQPLASESPPPPGTVPAGAAAPEPAGQKAH